MRCCRCTSVLLAELTLCDWLTCGTSAARCRHALVSSGAEIGRSKYSVAVGRSMQPRALASVRSPLLVSAQEQTAVGAAVGEVAGGAGVG